MRKVNFYVLLFALVTTSQQFFNIKRVNATVEYNNINYRLPNDSIPLNYKIKLIPNIVPNHFTFEGESQISLEIVKKTKNLTLHARDLKINCEKTTLVCGEETIIPDQHILDEERNFLILEFPRYLQPGNYILQLKYNGKISEDYFGLFSSSYQNEFSETVYVFLYNNNYIILHNILYESICIF